MESAGWWLMLGGIAVAVLGGLLLLVAAFRTSLGWGLACLLIPGVMFFFVITNWQAAARPFLVYVAGMAAFGGGLFLGPKGTLDRLSAGTDTRGEDRDPTPDTSPPTKSPPVTTTAPTATTTTGGKAGKTTAGKTTAARVEPTVEQLVEDLGSRDRDRRVKACFGLARAGTAGGKLAQLEAMAENDPDPGVRDAAKFALSKMR